MSLTIYRKQEGDSILIRASVYSIHIQGDPPEKNKGDLPWKRGIFDELCCNVSHFVCTLPPINENIGGDFWKRGENPQIPLPRIGTAISIVYCINSNITFSSMIKCIIKETHCSGNQHSSTAMPKFSNAVKTVFVTQYWK